MFDPCWREFLVRSTRAQASDTLRGGVQLAKFCSRKQDQFPAPGSQQSTGRHIPREPATGRDEGAQGGSTRSRVSFLLILLRHVPHRAPKRESMPVRFRSCGSSSQTWTPPPPEETPDGRCSATATRASMPIAEAQHRGGREVLSARTKCIVPVDWFTSTVPLHAQRHVISRWWRSDQ